MSGESQPTEGPSKTPVTMPNTMPTSTFNHERPSTSACSWLRSALPGSLSPFSPVLIGSVTSPGNTHELRRTVFFPARFAAYIVRSASVTISWTDCGGVENAASPMLKPTGQRCACTIRVSAS